MSYYTNRRDANEPALRRYLEGHGWLWLGMSRMAGFDAVLVRHGRIVLAEVKDPAKPPSARKLTPREQQVHAALKAHGVTVEILTDEASCEVLGREAGEYYR